MNFQSLENIFIIKRGLLDNLRRQLILTPDFIQFEDKNVKADPFTRFDKDSIKAYRFGIRWIRGFEFIIGREYQIFIQNTNLQTIKISFKTFYGLNKKVLFDTYSQILEKLWECYFINITYEYLEKFNSGETFELCNAKISSENITIKSTARFGIKTVSIPWRDMESRDYYTYFAIFSKSDTLNTNCSFNYLDDWNVVILYSVIRSIEKNLKIEPKIN